MKRTVTVYSASAYVLGEDLQVHELGPVRCAANSEVAARAALRSAGYDVPRGAKVKIEDCGSAVYECSLEEFLSVAHEVTEAAE
jgi:hypothetical protein